MKGGKRGNKSSPVTTPAKSSPAMEPQDSPRGEVRSQSESAPPEWGQALLDGQRAMVGKLDRMSSFMEQLVSLKRAKQGNHDRATASLSASQLDAARAKASNASLRIGVLCLMMLPLTAWHYQNRL